MKLFMSIVAIASIIIGVVMIAFSVLSPREDTFTLFILGAVIAQSGYSLRNEVRIDTLEGK